MSTLQFDLIIASDIYYIKGKDCGYCHGHKTPPEQGYALDSYRECAKKGEPKEYAEYPNSSTMGFVIYECTPSCYERLMENGFRRSGTFLYRPDMLRNCCRLYTIRTKLEFIPHASREHRHTINRFERFLNGTKATGKHSAGVPFDIKKRILALEDSERFHTEFVSTTATEEKYTLFRKYQMQVHHESAAEVSMRGFKRFLCETPFEEDHDFLAKLNREWRKGTLHRDAVVGPVHQCYYLYGKLIANAVLDILPESVSSVYFIWDPDYAHLGLGNLSALQELVLTEMLGKKYYYMGYYIDDCAKMRYKAKFSGEILDLCSRKYVRLDSAAKFIDHGRLAVFASDEATTPLNELEAEPGRVGEFAADVSLCNVAEHIYGVEGGSFARAENAAAKLGLGSVDQKTYWLQEGRDTLPLPNVSPGLMPLWQIHEMAADGTLDRLVKNVYLYDQTTNTVGPADHKVAVDLVRLLGVEQVQHRILYIS